MCTPVAVKRLKVAISVLIAVLSDTNLVLTLRTTSAVLF